ncbi:DnaJ domain-containing protein [Hoeflea sp. G2-23]|uniref:DnaJ domain-containing protein n=1 Tax=Hoeflea algicola TaxID=2983763 RepID=A0ABT3ZFF7_9HYPH|nr:DnaJ C-terminal domain-containing protein [Hoeflea algicola]MCY0150519.1 DnaJ domain-containing protein [Hoeflea algicola]
MRSPYTVLGVSKSARAEDIKSAYRHLAKAWHPDQKRDDPQAGARFSEISQAYKLLIDPDLRLKFDSGVIDARGRKRTRPVRGFAANPFAAFKQARRTAANADSANSQTNTRDEASFDDMVAHIFGEAASKQTREEAARTAQTTGRRTETNAPGLDDDPLATLDALFAKWKTRKASSGGLPATRQQIDISLETAMAGYSGEIVFGEDRAVAFSAPPGSVDGAEITVPSPDPSAYGDVIVTLRHEDHPRFRSNGADLHGEQAIDLIEAVLGGSFVYNSLDGPVRITIPEWSGSDTVLRVAGKGLMRADGQRGALHVQLRVMLPEKPDPRLTDLMRSSRKAWFL